MPTAPGYWIGAETAVAGARLAQRLRHCGGLVAGVHVLIIDGHLGAVGQGKGVTRLLAGGEVTGNQAGGLRGGGSAIGTLATKGCK
jgi:hypothetical protein